MKIHWITCCHMRIEVMKSARAQIEKTITAQEFRSLDSKIFVDHRYPIDLAENSAHVWQWADEWGAEFLRPPKNLGGHGGVSYVLRHLRPDEIDIVFVIDPDSYPVTSGWFTECVRALCADLTLGSVSLKHRHISNRPWKRFQPDPGDPPIDFLMGPEMFNMTAFRGRVLRDGFLGREQFPYYGHVESALFSHEIKLGMRHGYLANHFEDVNPIPHDEIYTKWKGAHARGEYPGNFDAFVREET